MKYVNTIALAVIAVASIVGGVVLQLNGHDGNTLLFQVGVVVGAIAGVTVPRNPAPAVAAVEPVGDLP